MVKMLYFVAFWLTQIVSSIIFKYGGINPKFQWPALIIGNIIILSASWFLVQLFKNFPQPIVIAVCSGGTFLTVQLAMALWFKESLNWIQVLGCLVIVFGMAMITFGGKQSVTP
ncbi:MULTISPECIES: hypothetical protein [Sphingobacterium]|uniref:Multidrug transporter EmrE-like cation transporter n=1 Tax=Sphingobacterium hotanense TaxID=649196 RepID=A0ABT7NLD4_9SPHI|nr:MULTISPECIES: hypothetical protein [Sphingobacterium]MDM1048002.1 hypothetical protein [Sphingobacterium hotanense]